MIEVNNLVFKKSGFTPIWGIFKYVACETETSIIAETMSYSNASPSQKCDIDVKSNQTDMFLESKIGDFNSPFR